MRRADFLRLAGLAVVAATTAGCSSPRDGEQIRLPARRILIPAAPGGGYDLTARSVAGILLESEFLDRPLEVLNVPGGGGVLGLSRLMAQRGDSDSILVMGLGIVGAAVASAPHLDPAEATPLARLSAEPGAILVHERSDIVDMSDLVERWRTQPSTVRVGGGSSVGGPDHLFAINVADSIGLATADVVFVPYSGGGDVLTGLVTGSVDVGFAGAGEMRPYLDAGDLRALAVSSRRPVDGILAPTLTDLGLDVEFENWRGFIGPPGMPEADRTAWTDVLRTLHETDEWKDVLRANLWRDAYLEDEEFRDFLTAERSSVQDILQRP